MAAPCDETATLLPRLNYCQIDRQSPSSECRTESTRVALTLEFGISLTCGPFLNYSKDYKFSALWENKKKIP